MIAAPVFLQTGFRSGGTWLWSCFRAHPGVLAFCEPLNEALESLTPDMIAGLSPETSQLKHPTLDAPYFSEFSALLNENGVGVRHYRPGFGIQSYFDMPASLAPELARYLHGLLDHASRQGRQPVLKFTRALGRAGWLRAQFPQAMQILLLRPPLEQFQSGWDLAQHTDNPTFLMIPLFIASRPETGPLRELCEHFGIARVPASRGLAACTGAYAAMTRDMSPCGLLAAFLGMFILATAASAPYADLIIDPQALGSPSGRHGLEHAIHKLCGVRVDLSGYAGPGPKRSLPVSPTELQETIDAVCALFRPSHPHAVSTARALLGLPACGGR